MRLLGLFLAVLPACTFVKLGREVRRIDHTAYMLGRVEGELAPGAPIFLVHLVDEPGEGPTKRRSVQRLIPTLPEFGLLVRVNEVNQVAVFQDLNGDLIYGAEEPCAFIDRLEDLEPVSQGPVELPPLRLSRTAQLPMALDLRFSRPSSGGVVGEIVSLDDERFSEERVKEGLWSPLKATARNDYGLQLLAPHEPKLTPVLFVHGINGSPRNFDKLIASLDRTRFEPWVFTYPSGIRLPVLAEILANLMLSARDKFQVDRLYVVAHSMGGLVAKGALLELQDRHAPPLVYGLVTLATPWGGHPRAAFALEYAPEAVPSWIDLAPGSPYLKRLERPLGPDIPFTLFFGIGGRSDGLDGNNDGVVPLESQLPVWAEDQARVLYGFNLGHTELPRSPAVAAKLWPQLR